MVKCNLIVDSCCDLPPELVEGVTLLGFSYEVDGVSYRDDLFKSKSAHEFYHAMKNGATPTTAQIPILALAEAFTTAAELGVPTVYLAFASALSGNFNTALIARDAVLADYPDFELHLVDTHLASIAEGVLVCEAISQREKGLSAAELAAWAEEARFFVNEQFMVDDFEALSRGGRIPSTVAMAGAALDVKPLLNISVDGRLSLVGMARGRKKGVKQLVGFYQSNASPTGLSRYVMIGHSDCPKDLQRLKDALRKTDEHAIFVECNIGPVIGSHVGPGMLALSFWGVDKREHVSVADRIARKVKGAN